MEKATTPDEIPRLFTEAWNARRTDWLATLFEGDADFVNVVGIWWNCRTSWKRSAWSCRRAQGFGVAGRGHGAHLQQQPVHGRDDGLLVQLRHYVRGGVHPHGDRRG